MATCVYCLLFIAVGSRRDQRDRDVVVVVGSGESRRARAGKEASVSDAICDSRARRDAREPREEKKAFRARKKRAPFGHVGCDRTRRGRRTHLLAAVAVVYAEEGGIFVQAENRGVRVLRSKAGGGFGERRREREGSGDLAAAARNLPRARRVSARKVTEISPFATRGRRRDAGRDRHSRRPIPPRSRTSIFVRHPCIAVVPYLNRPSSPSELSLSVMG